MKINNEIIKALNCAIAHYGNRYQFSLKVKIPQQTIKRWIEKKTASINDDVWERLYPHIKQYMTQRNNIEIEMNKNVEAVALSYMKDLHPDLSSAISSGLLLMDKFSRRHGEKTNEIDHSSEIFKDSIRALISGIASYSEVKINFESKPELKEHSTIEQKIMAKVNDLDEDAQLELIAHLGGQLAKSKVAEKHGRKTA